MQSPLINGIPNRYDESPRRSGQKPSILINSPDKSSPTARQRSPSPGTSNIAPKITATPLSFDQSPKPLLNNTQPKPFSSDESKAAPLLGPSKPVGGLFSSTTQSNDQPKPSGGLLNLNTPQGGQPKQSGGLFAAPQATQPTGGLFAQPAVNAGPKPTVPGGLFAQAPPAPASSSVFSTGAPAGGTNLLNNIRMPPGGSAAQPAQISAPAQSTAAPQGQSTAGAAGVSAEYLNFISKHSKVVDEIGRMIKDEMTRANVEKIERIPGLRNVLEEVRPVLNTKLTNELGSVLRSADIIISKFTQYQGDQMAYYGLLEYIVENIMKGVTVYYHKGQKLTIYFRIILLLILNNRINGLMEFVLLKIASEIPALKGVEAKRLAGMSQEEFMKLKGYKYEDGDRESYDEYSRRMEAYSYLFFMLLTLKLEDAVQDAPNEEKDRDTMQIASVAMKTKTNYDWIYWAFIKFFIKMPVELNSAHLLLGFYYSSTYVMRKQTAQVARLMEILYEKVIPKMERFGAGLTSASEKRRFCGEQAEIHEGKAEEIS